MQAYNFIREKKVGIERRKFRREGEEKRRDQLVEAALEIIAELGSEAATVRVIAERAGVTQGLIRHYFTSKDDLTRAAYNTHMQRINDISFDALEQAAPTAGARLSAFVLAPLQPQALCASVFSLWSAFLQMVRRDPDMAAVHEANYLAYRNRLESLIAAFPGPHDPDLLRRQAIACNAVIDGLWLEGSAYPEGFNRDELAQIGLSAIASIIGITLPGMIPLALNGTAKDTLS